MFYPVFPRFTGPLNTLFYQHLLTPLDGHRISNIGLFLSPGIHTFCTVKKIIFLSLKINLCLWAFPCPHHLTSCFFPGVFYAMPAMTPTMNLVPFFYSQCYYSRAEPNSFKSSCSFSYPWYAEDLFRLKTLLADSSLYL